MITARLAILFENQCIASKKMKLYSIEDHYNFGLLLIKNVVHILGVHH